MSTFSMGSRLLLFAGLAVLCATMVGAPFFSGRGRQRRAYWLGWLLGGSMVTVSVAHRGLDWALMLAGTLTFFSVFLAFMKSPYLKVGGRILALTLDDRRPDPSERTDDRESSPKLPADRYGNLSAGAFWWLATFLVAAAGAGVALAGWHDIRLMLWGGFLTVAAGLVGYGDAVRGFARARGKRLPALLATAASILLFGLPPLLYLLGYQIGRCSVEGDSDLDGDAGAAPYIGSSRRLRP